MPRRSRRSTPRRASRRNRRSRGSALQPPGVRGVATYSGQLNPNGKIALTLPNVSQDNYRVLSIKVEVLSEKPSFFQMEIRTEQPEEGFPSRIIATGTMPRTLSLRQPYTEGWWEGDGTTQKVGWFSNIGSNTVSYNASLVYARRDYIKVVTRNSFSVLPGHHSIELEPIDEGSDSVNVS